jgi:hypothetical protein
MMVERKVCSWQAVAGSGATVPERWQNREKKKAKI